MNWFVVGTSHLSAAEDFKSFIRFTRYAEMDRQDAVKLFLFYLLRAAVCVQKVNFY